MKKIKNYFLSLIILILFSTSISLADSIKLNINGDIVKSQVNPIVQGGRTLVPLRVIFEALNAEVDWDNSTRTVTGTQNGKVIILKMNNKVAQVDGSNVSLDVPGQVINGNVFVPVRFIAESLGANVTWDSASNSVIIHTSGRAAPVNKETNTLKSYKVTRVVDGDTIKVTFNGKEESVRLIGIDTPESVHPDASKNIVEGKTASAYTKEKLEGKVVELEFDAQERDQYGRLLAYVWIDGVMFNKTLLSEGYAQVSTYPPNVKYVDEFTKLQGQARNNNKGFWAYDSDLINSTSSNATSKDNTSNSTNTVNTTLDETKDGTWIKGNQNSKIYHVPSGRDYDKVSAKNIVWFQTEKEAQEAGYRRAMQ